MTEIANVLWQPFTGASAIAEALAPGVKFRLLRIELNLSAAATQDTLTVTLDAGNGTAYDTILFSRAMGTGSVQDLVIPFGEKYVFEADDEIDIAWTNTDARTYGGRYVYELPK